MTKLTDKQNQRTTEFKKLNLRKAMETSPVIRMETEHGETKRLSISAQEMEAITMILMINTGK